MSNKPNRVGYSVPSIQNSNCWLGSSRMLISWARLRWGMSGQRTPSTIARHLTDLKDSQVLGRFRNAGLLDGTNWLKRDTLKQSCKLLGLEHALVDIDAQSIRDRLLRYGPFLFLGKHHVLVISGIYIDDATQEATVFYRDPFTRRLEKKGLGQLLQDEAGARKLDLYQLRGPIKIRDLGRRKHDWHYQWDIIFLPLKLVPPKVQQSRKPPSKSALDPAYARHIEQMQQLGWDLVYLSQFFGADLYGMAYRGPRPQVERYLREWGVMNSYFELWRCGMPKGPLSFLRTRSFSNLVPIKIDLDNDGRIDAILRPGPGGRIASISVDIDGDGKIDHTITLCNIIMMDIDNDGEIDSIGFDLNKDGKFDFVVGDRDGDGILDWWANDHNGDGKPDWVAMDLDNDGNIDWLDTNGDGAPDFIGEQFAKGTSTVPGDLDGDQTPDWLEQQFESGFGVMGRSFEPTASDANGNGVPDWMERGGRTQFGTDINEPYRVHGDFNGNGVPDAQERGGFQQFNFGFNNPNNPFNPNNPLNSNNPLNPINKGPFQK